MTALIEPDVVTPPGRLRLLPDVGGAVRVLALQVVPEASARPQIEIIRALPHAHALLVVGDAATHGRLRGRLRSAGIPPSRYTVLDSEDSDLSLWARDTFAAAMDERGRPVLLVPPRNGRDGPDGDRAVPYLLRAEMWPFAPVVESRHYFEGGNIVADGARTFVGYDVIADNVSSSSVRARQRLLERLREEFGTEVIVIGSAASPPPLEHIDMFLTPLGDGRVLVGDPMGAVCTLLRVPWARWAHYEARFNRPRARGYSGPPFSLFDVLERNGTGVLSRWFDTLAARLAARGLEVHRMPLLVTDEEGQLPIVTYNNVIQ